MKRGKGRLILGFILMVTALLCATPLFAGTAERTWTKPTTDANGDPLTDLTGYKIYYGTSPRSGNTPPGGYNGPGSPVTVAGPDQLTYTFSSLTDGYVYYFSVTSYNSNGESVFSNEGSKAFCSEPGVVIQGVAGFYKSINSAYHAAETGQTLLMQAKTFNEGTLNMDGGLVMTLSGGYNCGFAKNAGFTTIDGVVTISNDKVTVENVIIQ